VGGRARAQLAPQAALDAVWDESFVTLISPGYPGAFRMRRLLIAVFLLAVSAPAAGAATGPCRIGDPSSPTCKLWTGRVTFIGDGDTVSVKLDSQKPKDAPVRVRVTGIQAMEEHVYTTDPAQRTGECHANEATARLEYLVKLSNGRVQLAAQDEASHSNVRLRRQVRVNINGAWRDVGRMLIAESHVLPLSNRTEWATNASYSALSQKVAYQRTGIYNSYYCGPGPEDLASLRVWANSNPPGDDSGEWAKVRNLDPVKTVAIGGWWLRDSDLRRYTFPPTATIPAGGTITVYVGRGAETATDFFWGYRHGVFDNVADDGRDRGDGAYLFDTEGDLRAWMTYPCRYRCTDPLKGSLKVTGHPKNPEHIGIKNVSSSPLGLEGYRLTTGSQLYAFPSGTILQAGETLRVNVEGDPAADTALVKGWGLEGAKMPNSGGVVKVSTFDSIELACDEWGSGTCS
jgi:endonuclease YncB( thermonuclease family)